MGGSGAGKSSLLAALIGFLPLTSGQIYFNGVEANLADRQFRASVGFVPQHDVLLETLTVKENVSFAANLRLRDTRQRRAERVKSTLKRLQLWDVRHSIVSQCSGGQRRRCSMAMELVCDPAVLFLDEVTSGLDSESAQLCMDILSRLAVEDGKTVIVVIHQPSFKILKLVHHILVLRRGGRLGWDGPGLLPRNADEPSAQLSAFREAVPAAWREPVAGAAGELDFIEAGENVADWIIERVVAMPEAEGGHALGHHDAAHVRARRDEAMLLGQPPRAHLPSALYQFFVFSGQSFQQITRNYQKLALSVALVLLAAIILGYTFRDDYYIGPVDPSVSSQCPAWLAAVCKVHMGANEDLLAHIDLF
jgi:ABC-type lipoprotein export system ATPase subunit